MRKLHPPLYYRIPTKEILGSLANNLWEMFREKTSTHINMSSVNLLFLLIKKFLTSETSFPLPGEQNKCVYLSTAET